MAERITMTSEEYFAEATKRFGPDPMDWAVECPVCHHVQTARDYQQAGAPENAVAFSCVGRWIPGSKDAFTSSKKGPCNYTGGGLFKLNPVFITDRDLAYFALAPAPVTT